MHMPPSFFTEGHNLLHRRTSERRVQLPEGIHVRLLHVVHRLLVESIVDEHRSTEAYVSDPFTRHTAAGADLYTADLRRKVGELVRRGLAVDRVGNRKY